MKRAELHPGASIEFHAASTETELALPFAHEGISAGFPSPAQDFLDSSIDLNKALIRNPASTFYGKVKGHSMQDMNIHNGDILIIDKSLEPTNGKIAVCFVDGEFTVKRIKLENNCCWLMPANENYAPIKITAENEFMVWGIVIHVIKSF